MIVALLFGLKQQDFGQIDGPTSATDVYRLMTPNVTKVEQRVATHERDGDRAIDQSIAQIRGHLLQYAPEKQHEGIGGMQAGQATIFRKMRQAGLLAKQDHALRSGDRPVDVDVRDVAIQYAEIDLGGGLVMGLCLHHLFRIYGTGVTNSRSGLLSYTYNADHKADLLTSKL